MHTGYLASNTAESPTPSIQSTRAPMMRITPPDAPNAGGNIVFTIDFDEAFVDMEEVDGLQATDFGVTGGAETSAPVLERSI